MKEWVAIWGAGTKCKLIIEQYPEVHVDFVIDSSKEKQGSLYCGLPVKSPDDITEWKKGFIIVSNGNYIPVCQLLKEKNLVEEVDYCNYLSYVSNRIQFEDIIHELQESVYGEDKAQYVTISSMEQYEQIIDHKRIEYENILTNLAYKTYAHSVRLRGYCDLCEKETEFQIIYEEHWPHFTGREHLRCVHCLCNPRMRYLSGLVKKRYCEGQKVYIYEQITDTYKVLKNYIPTLIGSEYLGDKYESGKCYEAVIKGKKYSSLRHENALNLSFEDNSMDMMISLDVFEHVSNCQAAFREACRVLKPGASIFISVPLKYDLQYTIQRARIENGELVYIEEPEYHGDPLDDGGVLAFYTYGWDIVDYLYDAGFSKILIHVVHDEEKGYYGYSPYFEAVK